MEAKHKFNLMSLLAIVILLGLFVFLAQTKRDYTEKKDAEPQFECKTGEISQCILPDGVKGIKVCEQEKYSRCFRGTADECILKRDEMSAVCCKNELGTIFGCNGRTDFKQGEYVIIKVNLQKALQQSGFQSSEYKACGFSQLIDTDIYTPKIYKLLLSFDDKNVACSTKLNAGDFRAGIFTGIVPNADGKLKLVEWRAYPPSVNLSKAADVEQQAQSSTQIFLLEVNVGE